MSTLDTIKREMCEAITNSAIGMVPNLDSRVWEGAYESACLALACLANAAWIARGNKPPAVKNPSMRRKPGSLGSRYRREIYAHVLALIWAHTAQGTEHARKVARRATAHHCVMVKRRAQEFIRSDMRRARQGID